MKEATVTRLKIQQSKHDLTLHPGVKFKFSLEACNCGGVIMRYTHPRTDIPSEVQQIIVNLSSGEADVSGFSERTICGDHVHPRWFDFAIGGFDRKVERHLNKMKKILRRMERAKIRAEGLRAKLEA